MKVKIALIALLGAAALAGALLLVACQKDTYIIQYEYNGIVRLEVEEGKVFALEDLPSRQGYTFLGLFDAPAGGTQVVTAGGMSTGPYDRDSDATFYAQFAPNTYTIELDYGGGTSASGVTEVEAVYDAAIEGIPFDLQLPLYDFAGWFTQPDCGGEQVADSEGLLAGYTVMNASAYDIYADTIRLYAGYTTAKYEVTFCYRMDGTDDVVVSATHGSALEDVVPEEHLVDGQHVLAWSTVPNDTAQEHVFSGRITEDMTLYPCGFGYCIRFDPNGGSACNDIYAEAGARVQLPRPARAGYRFMGWLNGDALFSETTMPAQNVDLVASWQPLISFEENGGSEVSDVSAPAGAAIVLPVPVRSGYEFAGWYTESGEQFNSTAMPEAGLTLYAGWYLQHSGERMATGIHAAEGSTLLEALTIDLSDILSAEGTYDAVITVGFSLRTEGYSSPGVKPTRFDLLFCNDSEGTSVVGSAQLFWDGSMTASFSGSFTGTLQGCVLYVRSASSAWDAGFTLSNVVIGYTLTDRAHLIL